MAIQHQQTQSFPLDALYCEEDQWEEDEGEVTESIERERDDYSINYTNPSNNSLFPLLLLDQDLFWEDEELLSLFSKEQQTQIGPSLLLARKEAVDWILKVKARHGFSALTPILSINYLDRFLSSLHFQKDKQPWMIQLLAVTCLSLAAKIEETQVPLLLDLQVEDTKYLFEAKNIKKMELLVMSTLQWRMNPVTPISFLDHIVRRLGLKTHLHWQFFKKCEALILSLVSDSRFVHYLPSVLATATMLHVVGQVEPSNPIEYQNQLLAVLKTTKEKVNECYELIVACFLNVGNLKNPHNKRKYDEDVENGNEGSPIGVTDVDFSSFDDESSSNDSNWALSSSSVSSSSSTHHRQHQPLFKKMRLAVQEQQQQH